MSRFALAGDLEHFFPAEVLQLLSLARATGRLDLTRSGEHCELWVEHGRPVFARTNGVSVHVGDVLVHRGDIPPEAVDLALALQRDHPGERIGRMLVKSGAVTEDQVREAVLEVQRRIIYRVLLWQQGGFRFLPGEHAEGEDIRLELDLDRLILEGLKLADQARGG